MQQPPAYQPQPAATVVYPPQPGQTSVVVSPAPVQSSYIIQNAAGPQQEGCCSGTALKFRGNGGMITGIIQLIIAVLCVILSGATYAFPLSFYYPAYGIWSGLLFFLPAGILGTISKGRSTCVIVAYLVFCILAAVESFGMIIYEGVYAGVYSLVRSCYSSCNYSYGVYCQDYCNTSGSEGAVAIHSVLAILAFTELVVSIVGAALCCGGLRCCCASPSTPATASTTTTTYYNQGGYVVQPAQAAQAPAPASQYPPGNKI